MLVSRRLDDQTYEAIVSEAEARLPWLCPVWTDHNAHDPGITVLELMAWYKELQQYHMDQITPAIRRKLLELAGLRLRPERAAVCTLAVPDDAPGRLAGTRLAGPQALPFELLEPIPARRPRLERVLAELDGQRADITELCTGGMPFQPFAFGGQESSLVLGLSQPPEGRIRLWFQVEQPSGAPRNPKDDATPPPRTLAWELLGAEEVQPLEDETWALSWSGSVTLPLPADWPAGEGGLYWLRLRQTQPGCEEQVRLSGLFTGRYLAAQQESRARRYTFAVPPSQDQQVLVASAQAQRAELAVFLRTPAGWEQISDYQPLPGEDGLRLMVNANRAAQDGEENLLVVALDPLYTQDLLFDGTGLPGQQVSLNLGGQTALTEHLHLLCQTVGEDGDARPTPWHPVEDLSACGPRDRVFVYDPQRETLTFGDGNHGAVPAPGFGSILVTELILSSCSGGNIPAGASLTFWDGTPAHNDAASGGRERETPAEGRGRLLAQLGGTAKCLSAEDYAQCARQTPGLRVAGAKALPGFDPHWGQGRRSAAVTVAVLPAGEGRRPVADRRFLQAVERQLERCRPICIRTAVVSVRYAPFTLSVQLLAGAGAEESAIRQAVEAAFAPRQEAIGNPVRRDDCIILLQRCPGVLQVRRLELHGMDQNSYETAAGDLQIPQDAIGSLERMEIQRLRP